MLPQISETTEAVIDLLKPSTLPQSLKNLKRNLNINHSISEQTEDNDEGSSKSEEAFRIIHVAIRSAIQPSEQLKENIVPREQALNKSYFIKSEQPSVKSQHYTNITI